MTSALEFSRASKQFMLQHERPESLQDRFVQVFRRRQTATPFWALRDVSFQVADGETFGILGRNGAGKSTLLKLATGILQPTSGRVAQHRRTYAMLELGAGFHPELTGRDNVLLNGSIHGLSRAETRAIFDQIVDFAELEPFIDTPVKHYSSGMFMRLGFATAIHMNPELLVIDEILAVGDAAFRRKCTEALWALKRQGVTILFVSHNEEAVYQFCDRALLLVNGQVAALGTVAQVVDRYTRELEEREAATDDSRAHLAIQAAAVLDRNDQESLALTPDQPWAIDVAVATPPGAATIDGSVALQTETGSPVITAPVHLDVADDGAHLRHLRARFATMPLHSGRFRLHIHLTATSPGRPPVVDEYLSTHSIVVGDAGYGPLLRVATTWTDRTATPTADKDTSNIPDTVPVVPDSPAAFERLFAEGATDPDVETHLHISNPATLAARVVLHFGYSADCTGPAHAVYTLPPATTITIDCAALVGRGKRFGIRLQADRPVLCEREMTVHAYPAIAGLAYGRPHVAVVRGVAGGHRSQGATSATSAWHFAEGYTGDGFDTYVAIFNPGATTTEVTLTYVGDTGAPSTRTLSLPGAGRRTVAVHDGDDPAGLGPGRIFGLSLSATAPVVAERVVYCRQAGEQGPVRGVTAVLGAPSPATMWRFPAGVPSTDASEYLALVNAASTPAAVTVRYGVADGRVERDLILTPISRGTVVVHEPPSPGNPAGLGHPASGGIEVIAEHPIVVERLAYWATAANDAQPQKTAVAAWPGAADAAQAGEALAYPPVQRTIVHHDVLALLSAGTTPAHVRLVEDAGTATTVLAERTLASGERCEIMLDDVRPAAGDRDLPHSLRVEVQGEAGAAVTSSRTLIRRGPLETMVATCAAGEVVALDPAGALAGSGARRAEMRP